VVLIGSSKAGTDGLDMLEQLRQRGKPLKSVIMMLPADNYHVLAARCRELGCGTYIIKPVMSSELSTAITSILSPTKLRSETAPSTTPVGSHPRPLKILLAEDNLVNQALAVRILQKRGHEVVLALTGSQAISKLAESSIDLILMDVQMPELDGISATHAIRRQEEDSGQHVPIIAMTAYAMEGDRERCIEAGMDDYLSKPIHPAELFRTIGQVLERLQKDAGIRGRPGEIEDAAGHPNGCSVVAGPNQNINRRGGL
jgi:CheY-like chemotaxis protein